MSCILVIDDEQRIAAFVSRALRAHGLPSETVCSGEEAIAAIRGGRFSLVILDLMMPREDGATTFQRLRQRRPQLPILLCTGLPQPDPVPQLLQAGGVRMLRKPFRMNELWFAVKQSLTSAPAPP